MTQKKKIWVVAGTRPEVIKQVSVYWALKKITSFDVQFVCVSQHKELLTQALNVFDLKPEVWVEVERTSSDLIELSVKVMQALGQVFDRERPDGVIVQGDTTTAFVASVVAFYRRVSVFHNEAGMRSYDLNHPFPEEANRKWISVVADYNFAPTDLSQEALLKEGVASNKIEVVGNTGIDAFFWAHTQDKNSRVNAVIENKLKPLLTRCREKKLKPVLVTSHRRENAGHAMQIWYETLRKFFDQHQDLYLICPIHPNQIAQKEAEKFFAGFDRVKMLAPMDYVSMSYLVKDLAFVVTDSGGLQEEAATLNKPVVICRKTTERREVPLRGYGLLTNPEDSDELLRNLNWAREESEKREMQVTGVYGNGDAGEKIAQSLKRYFNS